MSKNVVSLKSGSNINQGHWEWYHSIHRFWDIRLVGIQFDCIIDCIIDYFCTEPLKPLVLHTPLYICHYYITLYYITVTLKPGLGSLKVIENDTIQYGTHNFLLTFHINSGVFRGALCEAPPPFGRTAVIFVTILGLFLAPFRDKIAATSDQMCFFGRKML